MSSFTRKANTVLLTDAEPDSSIARGRRMTDKIPAHCREARRDVNDALAGLNAAEQAAVLAESMSHLLAGSEMDDINVALFLEAVCEVVPTRVRMLRMQAGETGGE
jgi:hypothetical protein